MCGVWRVEVVGLEFEISRRSKREEDLEAEIWSCRGRSDGVLWEEVGGVEVLGRKMGGSSRRKGVGERVESGVAQPF